MISKEWFEAIKLIIIVKPSKIAIDLTFTLKSKSKLNIRNSDFVKYSKTCGLSLKISNCAIKGINGSFK